MIMMRNDRRTPVLKININDKIFRDKSINATNSPEVRLGECECFNVSICFQFVGERTLLLTN